MVSPSSEPRTPEHAPAPDAYPTPLGALLEAGRFGVWVNDPDSTLPLPAGLAHHL